MVIELTPGGVPFFLVVASTPWGVRVLVVLAFMPVGRVLSFLLKPLGPGVFSSEVTPGGPSGREQGANVEETAPPGPQATRQKQAPGLAMRDFNKSHTGTPQA